MNVESKAMQANVVSKIDQRKFFILGQVLVRTVQITLNTGQK